jgi:hypothetical protein
VPQREGLPTCGTCGQSVRWIRTTFGARMPVDPLPDVNGNMVRREDGRLRILSRLAAEDARAAGWTLWMSHFRSCPDAEHHRRRSHVDQLSLL